MKVVQTIVAIVLGALLGWFIAAERVVSETQGNPDAARRQERISALDSNSSAGVPEAVRIAVGGVGMLSFENTAELVARLGTATAGECRRWLASLPDYEQLLTWMILERLAELDPLAAVEAIEADRSLWQFHAKIIENWAKLDFEAAVGTAVESKMRSGLISIVNTCGQEQVEPIYKLVSQSPDGIDPIVLDAIFVRIAQVDPKRGADLAIAKLMGKFPDPGASFGSGIGSVIRGWVRDDPAGALAWADGLENPHAQKIARGEVLRHWLKQDPLAALEVIGDEPGFLKKSENMDGLYYSTLSEENFAGVLDWIGGRSADSHKDAATILHAVVVGLANGGHPERLEEIVARFGEGELSAEWSNHYFRQAANRWAKQDEDGLVEFINSVANERARTAAIRGLVNHLGESEPQRAIEFLNSLEEPVHGIEMTPLLRKLFAQDMGLDEAFKLLPERLRDEGFDVFIDSDPSHLGQSGLAESELAEFLTRQPPGRNRDAAISFTAGRWAREDAVAAALWVSNLEAGGIQRDAAGNVADAWAKVDFAAAASWALELEDPDSRSRALLRVAEAGAVSQPERIAEIAATVDDAGLRDRMLSAGLMALARADPEKASVLLEESEAGDEVRRQVTNQLELARALDELLD